MPAFRPPRKGVSYSEAIRAAYSVAPEDEVVLDTLELLHSSFVDSDGNPLRIRVVNDHDDLIATLEDDAPLDGGQEVTFKACRFRFQRPEENGSGQLSELEIQIDNVSKYLMPFLDSAKDTNESITVIWRPYCVSDLSGPHIKPPIRLTLRTTSTTMRSITGRAGYQDLANRRFPAIEYVARRFPNLVQR